MAEQNPDYSLDLRQGVRIPVKSSFGDSTNVNEAVASSLGPTGLSPKLSGRLKVFEHMLQVANEEAAHINENKPRQFGNLDKEGKIINKYMDLDPRFVHTVNHTAWNMYEDELSQHPEARQAAGEILRRQKEPNDDDENTMTPEQLYELFQRE